VNVIESGSALAIEAQTPSAKSKTTAIVPCTRIILPQDKTIPSRSQ
jgi:hypothetical protein